MKTEEVTTITDGGEIVTAQIIRSDPAPVLPSSEKALRTVLEGVVALERGAIVEQVRGIATRYKRLADEARAEGDARLAAADSPDLERALSARYEGVVASYRIRASIVDMVAKAVEDCECRDSQTGEALPPDAPEWVSSLPGDSEEDLDEVWPL